jgi:hypothetical protein
MMHLVVSHGADFFGVDRHPLKALTSLAGYAEGTLPHADRGPLVQLLSAPAEQTIPAAEAATLATLLLRVARHKFTRPAASTLARALGDAAARAAAAGELWQWTIEPAQRHGIGSGADPRAA